jgi:tetratricopeptide (TPR) repeat protein
MKRVVATLAMLCLGATAHGATDPAARALIDGGHWKRLRALAAPRVAANPNDAQAAFLLGYAKWAFGDLDGAQPLAEKAVALDGRNADFHYLLARVYGKRAQRAGMLKGMSPAGKFRKSCEAALAIDPNHVDAMLDMMEFYYEAPGVAGGDKKRAAELVGRVTSLNPTRGYLAQADLASREKEPDWKKIESLERKALESNPKSYQARLSLAGLYTSEPFQRYDESEQLARAALELDPTRSGAYSVLAQLYVLQDRWPDLDRILAEAEKAVPEDLTPYYQAGRLMTVKEKDPPRAERYLRKYLSQEPEGLKPSLASAHWRLGLTLEKEGRKSEATAEIETALKLQPDLTSAKKDLKRLK